MATTASKAEDRDAPSPAPPAHHGMSAKEYCLTRLSTLKPPMNKVENPFALLATLNARQWSFFAIAFLAWSWDAFDFFTVSLTVSELAKEFDKTSTQITWGITLVLMFRSVGSAIFGIAADRYGRKWPFVVNNLLFVVLELGTGFSQTYGQFLACRALFGIAMGGLYGNAAATALEDCPDRARGIISGMLQQGYAFGYLLATAFARGLVNTTPYGWRPLFWFGACPPIIFVIWRLFMPETETFASRMAARRASGSITHTFLQEGRLTLRAHWLLLTYLVLLMAGFNFLAHGSQDLYPLFLRNQLEFSADAVTVTQVVASLGGLVGGTTVGYASQILGRRFSIVAVCIVGAAVLYPYTFVADRTVAAAAFFEQFCVQGAWGVVPIHLMELSPASFRTFIVGTAYQLGNLASSASSTIESTAGDSFPLPPLIKTVDGKLTTIHRYDYGLVICIFMGCVYAYTILLTLIGPENLQGQFRAEPDEDLTIMASPAGGSHGAPTAAPGSEGSQGTQGSQGSSRHEKGDCRTVEVV